MIKLSIITAIALSTLTLNACNKPNATTSPKSEAASSPTPKVVNQREKAAQQQANKLEQKRTQVQQSVMQSEQKVKEAETQAK